MAIKTRQQLIRKHIDFFKSKQHKEIPSASLIPENDPTVLFTTAGMHPLIPFLLGQPHPLGKRIVNVQKCIRTGDIDDVGDTVHHTFFEMLGNWSLGDYWKKEAIKMTFEFFTKHLNIPIEKLAVTCFKGDKRAEKDTESEKIWLDLGIPSERIAFLGEDNWWGPAGETGPCGPCTEQFYWKPDNKPAPKKFNPNDPNWVEIGNDVLMQYNKDQKGNYNKASQQNIDFGGGVERTLAVLNNLDDNYQTTLFQPIIKSIEKLSNKKYGENQRETEHMRIIADHIKAATMILSEKLPPSNLGQGYVLRRLIRRAIRYGKELGINKPFTHEVAESVIPIYPDYSELKQNKSFIIEQLKQEEEKFSKTLESGLKKFHQITQDKSLSGKEAFLLFQSYGFPIEMTQELAKENKIKINLKEYEQEAKKHQTLSRTSSAGQFKSGLQDNSEQTTKLHTATHLLNQALREIIDKDISQKGSNINPERLRFDYNIQEKPAPEQLQKVEDLVNKKIKAALNITKEELPLEQAFKSGAKGEFGAKYPDIVSIYTIQDPSEKSGYWSKEICTGPHVQNTKQIGTFKIMKEESVAAGIRRIRATVG